MDADRRAYIAEARKSELRAIVEAEALDAEATDAFVKRAFSDGGVSESGVEVATLMTKRPSRFAPANVYAEMKVRIVSKLQAYVG